MTGRGSAKQTPALPTEISLERQGTVLCPEKREKTRNRPLSSSKNPVLDREFIEKKDCKRYNLQSFSYGGDGRDRTDDLHTASVALSRTDE